MNKIKISTKVKILVGISLIGFLTVFHIYINVIFIMLSFFLGFHILSSIKKDIKNLENIYNYLNDNNINNYTSNTITEDEIGGVTLKLYEFFVNKDKVTEEDDISNNLDTDISIISNYVENLSIGIIGQDLSQNDFD